MTQEGLRVRQAVDGVPLVLLARDPRATPPTHEEYCPGHRRLPREEPVRPGHGYDYVLYVVVGMATQI